MRLLMTASLCVLATAFAIPAGAAPADKTIELTVDTAKPGATIDRHIFGQFAEQLGHGIYDGIWVGKDSSIPNTRGIRNDVVAALKAIKVPNVRWPGGCYADSYHWRDGVGAKRTTRVNTAWGNVVDSNAFGTDEYMDFIAQIGSEAYVSLDVGAGTVAEAQDWMEYMTADQPTTLAQERAANGHPAPYRVAMMGIGNESWDCGGLMTPDEYTAELRRYARFVGSYNSKQPTLKIAVGPGTEDTAWTEAVMKTWKERRGWSFDIQGLSLHSYTVYDGWPPHMPGTGFDESAYAHVLKETLKMGPLIDKQSAVMDKYDPDKKIALVVDEWGAWLAPTPGSNPAFLMQENSQRDAIIAALNINIFSRRADRVRMANIAQMINVLQAMILTDGPKMVLTPTYHVFKMYVPFQGATFIPVTYDANSYVHGDTTLPRLDAIAAKGVDGKIWLSLTNLDPNASLVVDAAALGFKAKSATGQTLSAPKVDSINTFEHPDVVTPKPISGKLKNGAVVLTLPPASVTVVSLEP
ncbi:alpha-N-arabinofuranosidase [Asticcacaulis sp. 201]|uniref:alpha-N-arabinofuranosidase n=1 Tax=Asticcacaulis sp. 201 TaxID=3028787 RepID=UPI002915E569|nr:alpha-L-arabinofuranosidase C-terminal domain-containing protein [Asticcacaulis sp. 201]MDV6331197.1 alpha-L-arabinofuranosidase C-terminal domain-containing protein [Asticcacaulis sp. 201]